MGKGRFGVEVHFLSSLLLLLRVATLGVDGRRLGNGEGEVDT